MVTLVSLNKQLQGTGYSIVECSVYDSVVYRVNKQSSHTSRYVPDIAKIFGLDIRRYREHPNQYCIGDATRKYLSEVVKNPDIQQLIRANQSIRAFTREQCQQYLEQEEFNVFWCKTYLVQELVTSPNKGKTALSLLFPGDVQDMFNLRCQQVFKPQLGDMVLGGNIPKPRIGDMVLSPNN